MFVVHIFYNFQFPPLLFLHSFHDLKGKLRFLLEKIFDDICLGYGVQILDDQSQCHPLQLEGLVHVKQKTQ